MAPQPSAPEEQTVSRGRVLNPGPVGLVSSPWQAARSRTGAKPTAWRRIFMGTPRTEEEWSGDPTLPRQPSDLGVRPSALRTGLAAGVPLARKRVGTGQDTCHDGWSLPRCPS